MKPADVSGLRTRRLSHAFGVEISGVDLREKLAAMGATPVGNTPEEFGIHMRRESIRWAKAVKESGAHVD